MEIDFEKNPICAAIAGIESVYYADIEIVNSIMPTTGGVNVTLTTGHNWSVIESDQAKATTEYQDTLSWNHLVELVYHGNQQSVEANLKEMTERRFVIKVVDNNGVAWLYGHECSPLRFRYTSENDGEADGTTAYSLTFEGVCPEPAAVIVTG